MLTLEELERACEEKKENVVRCKMLIYSATDRELWGTMKVFLNEHNVTINKDSTYSGGPKYTFDINYMDLIDLIRFMNKYNDDFEISF